MIDFLIKICYCRNCKVISTRVYVNPDAKSGQVPRETEPGSISNFFRKNFMEEQTNKLYVGNLPYSVNDDGLKEIFAAAGDVVEAKVITDKFSGRSKGFGFVTMKDAAGAEEAIKQVNGKDVEGRALKVSVARPMRE